MVVNDLNFSKK